MLFHPKISELKTTNFIFLRNSRKHDRKTRKKYWLNYPKSSWIKADTFRFTFAAILYAICLTFSGFPPSFLAFFEVE